MKGISNFNIRQFFVLGIIAFLSSLTLISVFSVDQLSYASSSKNAGTENSLEDSVIVQTNSEAVVSRGGLISRIRNLANSIRDRDSEENATLAIDEQVSEDNTLSEEFERLGIQSCSTVQVKQTSSFFPWRQGNVTTAQIVIPSWNWLNSSDPYGVGASQFSTPVAIAQKVANEELNLVGNFALPSEIIDNNGNEIITLPISGNGMGAFASLVEAYSRTGVTENLKGDTSLSEFVTAIKKIQTVFNVDDQQQISDLIDEPFTDSLDINSENLSENVSLSSQDIFQPNRLITPEQAICISDDNSIYSYYSGDLAKIAPTDASTDNSEEVDYSTGLEFVLDNETELPDNPENIDFLLPFGNKMLADIYSLDSNTYFNTFLLQGQNAKIIHNNDCALNVGVRFQSYQVPEDRSIFERINPFSKPEELTEEEVVEFEIFENNGQFSPVATQDLSFNIPWLGCQPREFAKRSSITLNNVYSGREDYQGSQRFINRKLEDNFVAIEEGFENNDSIAQLEAKYSDLIYSISSDLFFPVCAENSVYPSLTGLAEHKSRLINLIDAVENLDNSTVSRLHREATILLQKTDCIDFTGQLTDPLEDYLCAEGLLSDSVCGIESGPVSEINYEDFVYDPDQCLLTLSNNNLNNTNTDLSNIISDNETTSSEVIQFPTKLIPGVLESARITSFFGSREYDGKPDFHRGIDLGASRNLPDIYPIASGLVVYAGPGRTQLEPIGDGEYSSENSIHYGNTVMVLHQTGLLSLYGHVQEIYVNTGDYVNKDTVIALMGNEGRSTGTHLHLEIRPKPNDRVYNWTDGINPLNIIGKNISQIENIDEITSEIERQNILEQCLDIDSPGNEQRAEFIIPTDSDAAATGEIPTAEQIKAMCPFDFSNITIEDDLPIGKIKNLVNSYGCWSDERQKQSIRDNYASREAERSRRVDLIYKYSKTPEELAGAVCNWMSVTALGFNPYERSQGYNTSGMDCGVNCSNPPKNFEEDLQCALRINESGGDFCLATTEAKLFNPDAPGINLESYGPVSDANTNYADYFARCMGELLKIPRKQVDGCLEYPFQNGFRGWQNFNVVDISTDDYYECSL